MPIERVMRNMYVYRNIYKKTALVFTDDSGRGKAPLMVNEDIG